MLVLKTNIWRNDCQTLFSSETVKCTLRDVEIINIWTAVVLRVSFFMQNMAVEPKIATFLHLFPYKFMAFFQLEKVV